MPPPLTNTGFVAIRKELENGREWIDIGTLRVLLTMAQDAATDTDRLIPQWSAANPVTRYARVTLTEETV